MPLKRLKLLPLCSEAESYKKTQSTAAMERLMVFPVTHGKGNSNSHGARPVHLIITMIKWIRTSSLSIKNSLFDSYQQTDTRGTPPITQFNSKIKALGYIGQAHTNQKLGYDGREHLSPRARMWRKAFVSDHKPLRPKPPKP